MNIIHSILPWKATVALSEMVYPYTVSLNDTVSLINTLQHFFEDNSNKGISSYRSPVKECIQTEVIFGVL